MKLDLLIRGARVLTQDPERPRSQSIGVWRGQIIGVDEEIDHLVARRAVDVGGAVITPGFHDAHCHTTSYGVGLDLLDLTDALEPADVLDAVRRSAASLPPDHWVIGTGWRGGRHEGDAPSAGELDEAAAGRRVWLTHVSGHLCVVSSAVLEAVDVTSSTPDPVGGRVHRDVTGAATGILEDLAIDPVKELVGPASVDQLVQALDRATAQYVREGITAFTEAGIGCPGYDHGPREIAAYQQAGDLGVLRCRASLMIYSELLHHLPGHRNDQPGFGLDLGLRTGLGDAKLRIGAMKIWVDGSGIGGSAALTGGSETDGFQDSPDGIRAMIADAHRNGWQVAAHAMGDAALDLVLEGLESTADVLGCRRLRHRVEHAGVVRPDQIPRMAALGMVAVPQPVFIPTFGDALAAALGPERTTWSLRAASFLRAGVTVAGSSDRPVAPGAPLTGMQAMVERLTAQGEAYGADERVGAEIALAAWTTSAAYASHSDNEFGQIRSGHRADFVVLDDDPTRVDPGAIGKIDVLATVVDGEVVHDTGGLLPVQVEA